MGLLEMRPSPHAPLRFALRKTLTVPANENTCRHRNSIESQSGPSAAWRSTTLLTMPSNYMGDASSSCWKCLFHRSPMAAGVAVKVPLSLRLAGIGASLYSGSRLTISWREAASFDSSAEAACASKASTHFLFVLPARCNRHGVASLGEYLMMISKVKRRSWQIKPNDAEPLCNSGSGPFGNHKKAQYEAARGIALPPYATIHSPNRRYIPSPKSEMKACAPEEGGAPNHLIIVISCLHH